MDEHVSDEAPRFLTLPWVVDKSLCKRSTCRCSEGVDILVVFVFSVGGKRLKTILHQREPFILCLNDISDEESYFDDTEDEHRKRWREKPHLILVSAI
jgi:hypothetical protein